MPAEDEAVRLERLGGAAGEDALGDGRGNALVGEPEDVEGAEGAAAHGVDVRERVRRRDGSVLEGVVHHRGEEIDRLHQGAAGIEAQNAGVVGVVGTDEDMGVVPEAEASQDLRQGWLGQFRRSTRAGGEGGQLLDPFTGTGHGGGG